MREDWEYKKLGEVFHLQMGKTPSRDNKQYWGGTGVWVSIRDMSGNKYISSSKECITEKAIEETNIKRIQAGTVIMSFKLSVGKVAITDTDLYTNEAIMAFNVRDEYKLLPDFIYYYFIGYKWNSSNRAVMGITLNKDSISKGFIPLPPLPQQLQIVEELDLLSTLIEKKKEQLKELDQLAQATFYEMFGDPVRNEKGWEKNKLMNICTKLTDGTHFSPKSFDNAQYKYVTAKNIKKDGFDFTQISYITEDVHRDIFNRCNPQFGDVLYIKDGATTGIAMINNLKEEFSLLSSVALLKPNHALIDKRYLKETLNNSIMYQYIRGLMGGAAITRLTIAKIKIIRIPVPPLPLQHLFAQKIEAIEHQKELIKQSLTDIQQLLAYTMNKYFG